ncbi:MAG: oligopeptide ABC transporter permease [Halanaerobiales bacterium]
MSQNNNKEIKAESPWAIAWRHFKKNKLAMAGLFIMIIVVLSAVFAPQLAPHDPYKTNILDSKEAPNDSYPLGTDRVGRDVLSRLLYGGRISLTVGLVAMVISVTLGTLMGLIAGYFGGWVDTLITRLIDVFMSIPFLIMAITIGSIWGPGLYKLMVIIGILSWTGIARIVRSNILSLRERDFIHASRALGGSDFRIMIKHLFPNTVAPIIVNATLRVAYSILSEAGLSYLGLGVQPPIPSWGSMLEAARSVSILEAMPWFWLPPGTMIVITVLSINFIGDGLRDALDPKLQKS